MVEKLGFEIVSLTARTLQPGSFSAMPKGVVQKTVARGRLTSGLMDSL